MKFTYIIFLSLLTQTSIFSQGEEKILTQLISYNVTIKLDKQIDSAAYKNAETMFAVMDFFYHVDKTPSINRVNFINALHDAVLSEKIVAYDPLYDVENDLPIFYKIPLNEIRDMTMDYKNGLPYSMIDLSEYVVQISFLEQWQYNSSSFQFKKAIIAFAPVMKVYDIEGKYRGLKTLYWIKPQ